MALPVISILRIAAELAVGIGSQWLKSRDNLNNKDINSRLKELEVCYSKQVELVEGMAKEMNNIAILIIQNQKDKNNDQKKYITNNAYRFESAKKNFVQTILFPHQNSLSV